MSATIVEPPSFHFCCVNITLFNVVVFDAFQFFFVIFVSILYTFSFLKMCFVLCAIRKHVNIIHSILISDWLSPGYSCSKPVFFKSDYKQNCRYSIYGCCRYRLPTCTRCVPIFLRYVLTIRFTLSICN